MKKLLTTGFCLLLGLSLVTGCGGGGSAPIVGSPPSAIAVKLTYTPSSLAIDINQSESLTAAVSNDPNNKGVNWTVTCGLAGTSCGAMAKAWSASGAANTYKASSSTPSPADPVTVTATSVSDPTKSAFVYVYVGATPTLSSSPPMAPTGNVGQYYYLFLSNYVQGGATPYTWKLKSGTLPGGLVLNTLPGSHGTSASFSGIPTAVSASTVVATFTDSGNPPISVNVPISITINPMLPFTSTLSSGALQNGTVGVPYECHWWSGLRCLVGGLNLGGATGGLQPYVFRVAATGSSLPPGLALGANMDGCGGSCSFSIKGTPTVAGTYGFLVTVTDSELPPKQGSANYTITIAR